MSCSVKLVEPMTHGCESANAGADNANQVSPTSSIQQNNFRIILLFQIRGCCRRATGGEYHDALPDSRARRPANRLRHRGAARPAHEKALPDTNGAPHDKAYSM